MHPNVPQCQYIKTNGLRCGSPALRRQRFCYFHYEVNRPKIAFNIPVLEDANAIQLVLTDVARLVADERLDLKRATVLGYLLQTASVNLKRVVLGCPTSVTELPEPTFNDEPADATADANNENSGAPPLRAAQGGKGSPASPTARVARPPSAAAFPLARVEAGDLARAPERNSAPSPDPALTRKHAVRAIRDAAPDILAAFSTRKQAVRSIRDAAPDILAAFSTRKRGA